MSGWIERWFGEDCPPWVWPGTVFVIGLLSVCLAVIFQDRSPDCPADKPLAVQLADGRRFCATLPIDLRGLSDVRIYGDGKFR